MLIERSQLIIGLIAAVVIGIGTALAVFSTGGLLVRGDTVVADFVDGAGVSDGDFVLSSGVRVGQVTGVEIIDDNVEGAEPCSPGTAGGVVSRACVRVTMKINNDGIPDDSLFEVTLQNALGRRQVRVIPGDSETFLAGGEHIGLDRTSTPIDLPELGDRAEELLGGLETDRLNALAISLADVLEGKEQEVSDLLDALDAITAVIAERKDELASVLEDATTLVDAAADKDQQIVTIIDEFGATLDLLAQRRTEIARLVSETARATTLSADLVEDRQEQLDKILTELRTDLEIIDERQVEVADFLAVLGVGFEGYANIGWHGTTDNPDWGNVFTTQLGAVGYGGLLDCGGVVDVVLSTLFGGDPFCQQAEQAAAPAATTGSEAVSPHQAADGYPGLAAWFAIGAGS